MEFERVDTGSSPIQGIMDEFGLDSVVLLFRRALLAQFEFLPEIRIEKPGVFGVGFWARTSSTDKKESQYNSIAKFKVPH